MDLADILRPLLTDMSSGLGSIMGLNLTDVLKSPSEYSPETASLMDTISDTVVMPVATLVLVALYMLELVRISVSVDGDKELFARVAGMTLVKFALLRVIFEATPVVMNGLYALFAELAVKANGMTVKVSAASTEAQVDGFLESVKDMDWLGSALLVILMLLAWLVNKGAVIVALALVVVRFVKLFIFTAFAPMPIALFANQDTRGFAIGFLRGFSAVVLQAFVLVLAFGVYQTITAGWAATAVSSLGDNGIRMALSIGGNYMLMGVVLGMVILGSGRLANELLGN